MVISSIAWYLAGVRPSGSVFIKFERRCQFLKRVIFWPAQETSCITASDEKTRRTDAGVAFFLDPDKWFVTIAIAVLLNGFNL
jgi:hypothetical protein